ncbi:hypothetical protein [Streptacidiphilus fuscans]|uniref:Uncharacterized protein n=1 Tax=Streptacidiphilus fuscans TaxID=2789292 RepID=A0A931FGC1_9ACTN|nr:hypothetical protein [Streptacidiphilus fuscans]MBF9073757.1 hypothetical protein [Streptacidiphilus fuscans]
MTIGHPPELPMGSHSPAVPRSLDATTWSDADLPLLPDPRAAVEELHRIHQPMPGATVLGVLSADSRVVAGASFTVPERITDGWHLRNVLLAHLRHTVPHGLRRHAPLHTAVLVQCRRGPSGWTEQDGAWMWALRDAGQLHGIRCGGYVTLTDEGWQLIGDARRGRSPHAGSWAQRPVATISELTGIAEQTPSLEAPKPRLALLPVEAPRVAVN